MTRDTGYRKMRAKYKRMIEEAKMQYAISGLGWDLERLEYLKERLKRYTT